MSRELIFYPVIKEEESGRYRPILYDMKNNPADIFWRSQSFIDISYFTDNLRMVGKEELDDCFIDMCFDIGDGKEYPTYIYELTEDIIYSNSIDMGIVSGYCPIEEVKLYYKVDCPQEYLTWEMSKPIPPEVYVELPEEEKKSYMKFYTIDQYSTSYICNILYEILDRLYVPYDIKGKKCILVQYSF